MIIPETRLSLNSKQDDINEINWMLIKYSVEFILCDCSRGNGILSSSLEKNISLVEKKKLGQSNKKWDLSSILLQLQNKKCESRAHPLFNQSSGGFICIICIKRVSLA